MPRADGRAGQKKRRTLAGGIGRAGRQRTQGRTRRDGKKGGAGRHKKNGRAAAVGKKNLLWRKASINKTRVGTAKSRSLQNDRGRCRRQNSSPKENFFNIKAGERKRKIKKGEKDFFEGKVEGGIEQDLLFQANLFEGHELLRQPVPGLVHDAVRALADLLNLLEVVHVDAGHDHLLHRLAPGYTLT